MIIYFIMYFFFNMLGFHKLWAQLEDITPSFEEKLKF